MWKDVKQSTYVHCPHVPVELNELTVIIRTKTSYNKAEVLHKYVHPKIRSWNFYPKLKFY